MTTITHACGCGAIYRLERHKLTARDKDSKDCRFCGETLIDWNGAEMWTAEVIEHPKDGVRE